MRPDYYQFAVILARAVPAYPAHVGRLSVVLPID